MPFYGIAVDAKGRHQVFRTVNGIYRLDVGPAFVSPRDAITYATELEATPSVSPLRSPGGRPTGSAAPPVLLGAEVDRPPGVPRGSSAGLGGQSQ